MSTFQKAERHKAKARLGIAGPSGSGKTYTALRIASAWAAALGGRVAVIDTEPVGDGVGSASLYADTFDFDTLLLQPPYHPQRFADAIRDAAAEGYVVTVIDGITPAWDGPGGVQEIVERAGGEFRHWGSHGNPAHQILVDAITNAPNHVITTMRSKMTYAMEEKEKANGFKKNDVVKLGMRPIQRDTIEYEHSIFGQVDEAHNLRITKSRNRDLQDKVFPEAGEEFAMILLQWLERGAPEPLDAAVKRQFKVKPELGAVIQGATGISKVSEIVAKYGERCRDLARLADELAAEKAAQNGQGAGDTDTETGKETSETGAPAPTPNGVHDPTKAAEFQAGLDAGEGQGGTGDDPPPREDSLLGSGLREAVGNYGDPEPRRKRTGSRA